MPLKTECPGQNETVSGVKFHTSNRLEQLAESLAETLARPAGPALAQEVIVVQSRGMARWTSLQIARLSGVCMGCEFPFPRAFIDRTLRAFFPEMAVAAEFSTGAMAWKIHALLPPLLKRSAMAPVKNYLEGDEGLKAFQLSDKIARLFDQYLVYRPEMLLRWERDTAEKGWQAVLWRELAGKGTMHLAAVGEQLAARMAKAPTGAALPGRVSVFGVPSLPPLYLWVFLELGRQCEVNLFSLEPSMEYFGHDLSPRMRAKLERKTGGRPAETGNPLLVSLGRLNRDFTELRLELDERAGFIIEEQPGKFVEPPGGDMLAVIQGDLLHACNRGDAENAKREATPGDRSIQIHACHSPMREIEILYDQMLDLFQNDSSLRPQDIIVMTPDIEKYAPFIQAVFGSPEEGARYIPFSVADRVPRNQSPIVATFLALLALPGSRCTASEIFSMLDRAPLRARFKFTDADMDLVRQWIADAGIRWGINGAHREELGVPGLDAATWRAGFQRLLLGYAMPGGDHTMFEGIVPCDDLEGSNAQVAGRFVTAAEALFELAGELPKERPLAEWPEALAGIAAKFFAADSPEEAADLRFVQAAVDQLREVALSAGGGQMAGFTAVRHFLSHLLDDTEQRGGFFTGGVTFCALKPMRSIPARVVCLIGMDDAAFPRRTGAPVFDMMARDSQCGDRSPRNDDRFSFLEAIISARGHFYVSYPGRSIVDNTEIPPSVLVSELLDYMDRAFAFPDGKNARAFVTAEHRLHAFSRRYFDGTDPLLFSYSGANAAASRNLQKPGGLEIGFLSQPLPEPAAELRNVELRALVDFLVHPARHFVRSRLGIRFEEVEGLLEDSEAFDIGDLEKYQLKQELVALALEKHAASPSEYVARGLLPPGGVGAARFHTLNEAATEFAGTLQAEFGDGPPGEPLAVDLRIGEFSLTGIAGPVHGSRIVHFRSATLKAKDWLRAWAHHLARCASLPGGEGGTLLAGDDRMVRFAPVGDSRGVLAGLLQFYWEGLRTPPHFFPASSFAYAEAEINPPAKRKTSPIDLARRKWDGGEWSSSSEANDVYNAFCFGNIDPLDRDFMKIALEIFEPVLRHAVIEK